MGQIFVTHSRDSRVDFKMAEREEFEPFICLEAKSLADADFVGC